MIADHKKNSFTVVHLVFIICLGVFFGVIYLFNYITSQEKKLSDRIYPNVYIDNKNVGWKTRDELKQLYNQKNQKYDNVVIKIIYQNQEVATLSATTYNIHSDGPDVVERAYLIGRTPNAASRLQQKISTLFNMGRYDFNTQVTYNKDPFDDTVADLETRFNFPAKNALFTFSEGRVLSFRPDEKGLKINSDRLANDFETVLQRLQKKPDNQAVTLTDSVVEPETTLSEANGFGIEEEIAEGKSDYTGSINERVHNVILGASKFHGILIPKDKVFSFDDVVGDISKSTGFTQAYVIKDGKTVLGDGGGICQVSTTLFRAAMNAGLPIVERHAHAYRVHYYENDMKPGFDATIFSPTVDFKFKNDSPAAILIQTEIDKENNILVFKFYGKKDGRVSTISDIKLYDIQPAPPALYQDDPTLPRGTVKQIDFAAGGAKASFKYKVVRGSEVLSDDTFYSIYKPWQAVFLQGTAG